MPRGAQGRSPEWAPLPVQYVDYTLWQRAQLGDLDDSDSRIAAQMGYWQHALAGMPERLQLPTDRPVSAGGRLARGQCGGGLAGSSLQQRVREVAGEHNATSFMVMQAASGGVVVARSAPVLMWRWGSRSPGAAIPRSMSWSGSSSTPWCYGSTWTVIPR